MDFDLDAGTFLIQEEGYKLLIRETSKITHTAHIAYREFPLRIGDKITLVHSNEDKDYLVFRLVGTDIQGEITPVVSTPLGSILNFQRCDVKDSIANSVRTLLTSILQKFETTQLDRLHEYFYSPDIRSSNCVWTIEVKDENEFYVRNREIKNEGVEVFSITIRATHNLFSFIIGYYTSPLSEFGHSSGYIVNDMGEVLRDDISSGDIAFFHRIPEDPSLYTIKEMSGIE